MEHKASGSRNQHMIVWGLATLFSLAWAVLAVSSSIRF